MEQQDDSAWLKTIKNPRRLYTKLKQTLAETSGMRFSRSIADISQKRYSRSNQGLLFLRQGFDKFLDQTPSPGV